MPFLTLSFSRGLKRQSKSKSRGRECPRHTIPQTETFALPIYPVADLRAFFGFAGGSTPAIGSCSALVAFVDCGGFFA